MRYFTSVTAVKEHITKILFNRLRGVPWVASATFVDHPISTMFEGYVPSYPVF
jgi:hypothetical protein